MMPKEYDSHKTAWQRLKEWQKQGDPEAHSTSAEVKKTVLL